MKENIVFVYSRNNKIKILSYDEANRLEDNLKIEGWIHTNTLDPCLFIQYLHNDCEEVDLLSEIKSLLTP